MTNVSTSQATKRPTVRQLSEAVTQRDDTIVMLEERLAELELALDDQGWQRILQGGEGEFSREALKKITALARLMALKNPLIKRGLTVQGHYVWGQGVTIQAKDKDINAVIQAFIDDAKNQIELTSHQARLQKDRELGTDGNLFFVFFVNRVTGRVRLRSIAFDEIETVVRNPDDAKEPWFYKRVWQEIGTDGKATTQTAYYPDWQHWPRTRVKTLNGHAVRWDTPIYHVKDGGYSNWMFGLSQAYASIDWARAYKEFLEDWATLTRAYSRFAHKLTTPGGKKGVAAAKTRMATTMGPGTGESNPPPTVGSIFVAGEGVDMQPMRIGGANVSAEDGRRMLLMVAAALDLPETFFGDVSVGTLATAESLDRPTELAMSCRQTFWAGVIGAMLNYVLLWAVKAPRGKLRQQGTVVLDQDEAIETLQWTTGVDAHVDIDFPPVIEIAPKTRIDAINSAAKHVPNPRLIARLVLTALGEDDIDEILENLFTEDGQLKPEYQPESTQPTDTQTPEPSEGDSA